MAEACRPLIEVLAEVPDFRKAQGERHPLAAILALACVAMMCGYRSYGAIAEWGRNYGGKLTKALGFTQAKTPSVGTLHTVFRNIDREALEAKSGEWAESALGSSAEELEEEGKEGVAIDGKRQRGGRKQGAVGVHLLSAVGQRLGVTLGQCAVGEETNEIGVMEEVLAGIVLEGRVITVDALLTQREVARTIVEGQGDYVMPVKGNQPKLLEAVKGFFAAEAEAGLEEQGSEEESERPEERGTGEGEKKEGEGVREGTERRSTTTMEVGHGRMEVRRLTVCEVEEGELDWPGVRQVYQLERTVECQKTGKWREQVVYGVTRLSRQEADAEQLLGYCRGHWGIENRLHWVRDVTYDEDRSPVRRGHIPQVMAALRNTAIGVMRWAGERNIAAACRRYAAQPGAALALLGIAGV